MNLYTHHLRPFWERLRSNGAIQIGRKTSLSRSAVFDIRRGGSIKVGESCRIAIGAILAPYGGSIAIGDSVSINPYTILYGHGGLIIGNNVRIAAHTVVIPANHRFEDPEKLIRKQGLSKVGIIIEDDVWVGAHVVILDGSHVGRGCVIAAGSIVRGNLEPMGVYAGMPARRVKERRA